ncbi:hypothetical protein [Flavobacterium sp.]|uniref:hypothetical protein n=1 Tax=Flavobacterium sp. TaxID=239 RepID=UPI002B4AF353|nr:hypothetical protein [Flavobacterium sp.]HLP63128.1 hypothetical protein [Flavobacterium sp.]
MASNDKMYNEIMNYRPKGISDSLNVKNEFLKSNLISLAGIRTCYQYKDILKLEESDINILEQQIDQFALAFYLENKPILIKLVGGVDGCPDQMTYEEKLDENDITFINFCLSCTEKSTEIKKFISIFNKRTRALITKR